MGISPKLKGSLYIGDLGGGAGKTETYYRTMSQADYDQIRITGELPSTGETFISPTKSFSDNYSGVTLEFQLNKGTTSQLQKIGRAHV